jgi:hypothetical protein
MVNVFGISPWWKLPQMLESISKRKFGVNIPNLFQKLDRFKEAEKNIYTNELV